MTPLTSLGKYLRILRAERDIMLKDMADDLNVSRAWLSALEHGERTPGKTFIDNIIRTYKLDKSQIVYLKIAYFNSIKKVEINLTNMSDKQINLAILIGARIHTLDEEEIDNIIKTLS